MGSTLGIEADDDEVFLEGEANLGAQHVDRIGRRANLHARPTSQEEAAGQFKGGDELRRLRGADAGCDLADSRDIGVREPSQPAEVVEQVLRDRHVAEVGQDGDEFAVREGGRAGVGQAVERLLVVGQLADETRHQGAPGATAGTVIRPRPAWRNGGRGSRLWRCGAGTG